MNEPVAVHMHGQFVVTSPSREDLDEHTDLLMVELTALEGPDLMDSAVGVDLAKGLVDIEVVSVAASFDEAVEAGDAAVRAAIHAAGGATPGWRAVSKHAELVEA